MSHFGLRGGGWAVEIFQNYICAREAPLRSKGANSGLEDLKWVTRTSKDLNRIDRALLGA